MLDRVLFSVRVSLLWLVCSRLRFLVEVLVIWVVVCVFVMFLVKICDSVMFSG